MTQEEIKKSESKEEKNVELKIIQINTTKKTIDDLFWGNVEECQSCIKEKRPDGSYRDKLCEFHLRNLERLKI